MRSKYLMHVLITLILIAPTVSAAYDYDFHVGTHQVKFNTSTPIWEITKPSPGATDYGYEETFSPTYQMGAYASSYTSITAENNSDGTFLRVEIRDFDIAIPRNVMQLEIETVGDFVGFLPLGNIRRTTYFLNGIAFDTGKESFGVIVDWPSDQTEIIITGRLPNTDMWQEISKSLELIR